MQSVPCVCLVPILCFRKSQLENRIPYSQFNAKLASVHSFLWPGSQL